MKVATFLKWDATLQARQHIFTANAISTLAFCGLIALIPKESLTPTLASLFIFADPALIGLSFIGAAMLMERGTRVNLALGVSPMPPSHYVISKSTVLTLSGTISGLGVAAICAYRGLFVHWALLTAALVASNVFAVLVGFIAASTARSMNHLMMRLLVVIVVLFIPLLSHFGLLPWWVFAPIPSAPMLWWLDASLQPAPDFLRIAIAAVLLFVVTAIAYRRAIGPSATAALAATP